MLIGCVAERPYSNSAATKRARRAVSQDLKLKVEAKFPMMIAYRDPLAAVEIPWVRDGEKSDDWKGLSMQLDAGLGTC